MGDEGGPADCQTQTLIDGDGKSCVQSCATMKIRDDRYAATPGKTDSECRRRSQNTLWQH